jgi:Tfp pilus assembly protein PilZ
MQSGVTPVFIVILSNNKEEQGAITEAIQHHSNVEIAFVSNIDELRNTVLEQPCNGFLLFIASLIGMDETGKSFIQTLEHVYPVARIRWHKAKGSFALIGSRHDRVETLSDFVQICAQFSPRCYRRSERFPETLNVIISQTPDFSHANHSFTIDISLRGCFLHVSQEWNIGNFLFMQIMELPEQITFHGQVTRYVPWGVPFNVQGIGVQFTDMDNKHIEALRNFIYHMSHRK